MFNKIKKVFGVYTSTWSFWIVVAVVVPLVVIVVPMVSGIVDYDRVTPEPSAWTITLVQNKPVDPETVELIDTPQDQSSKNRSAEVDYKAKYEVDWEQFNMKADGVRVNSMSDYGMWDRFAEMPNLEFLDLKYCSFYSSSRYSKVSREERIHKGIMIFEDLKNLERISKLKSLRLPVANYESEDLAILSKLKKLQWLDISFGQITDGLESFPRLDELEVLHIRYVELLTKEAVAHLNSFPKLKTIIVLKFDEKEPVPQKMKNSFSNVNQNINGLTQVETIYLPHQMVYGEYAQDFTAPQLSVFPSAYNETRNAITFFTFVILLCLSAALGVMLIAQFSRPESQLTPNYNTPHYAVAGLLLAVCILGGVFAMVSVGVNIWAAIAVCLFSLSFICIMSLSPIIAPAAVIFFFVSIIAIVISISMDVPQLYFERFLIGLYPTVTAVMASIGLLLIASGILRMRYLYHILIASGLPNIAPNLGNAGSFQTQVYGTLKESRSEKFKNLLPFPLNSDFKSEFSSIGLSKEERSFRIWKLPSGFSGRGVTYFVFVLTLALEFWFFIQYWMNGMSPPQSLYTDVMIGILILIVPFYFGSIASSGWYQRIPMLSRELCLPISRRELLDNLYRGFFQEFRWLTFVPVILTSPIVLMTHNTSESLIWITAYLIIAAGSTCLAYGTILWSLQIRKAWKITLLYIFGIALVFFTITGIGLVSDGTINILQIMAAEYWFLLTGCILFAIGLFVIRYAKQRWSKLEFATLG